jgi:hypothetical protein
MDYCLHGLGVRGDGWDFHGYGLGSKDAHINPAVTLGGAIASGNFSKLGPYITAQMLGGFAGAVLVWLHFLPHWAETADPIRKLSCFCSHPAIPNKIINLVSEIIPTCTLCVRGRLYFLARQHIQRFGWWFGPIFDWRIGVGAHPLIGRNDRHQYEPRA